MNHNMPIRQVIDVIMTALMLVEMACRYTGNMLHELFGISLMVLFIIHNILNRKWYLTVFKGKYSILRVLNTAINLLLLVMMVTLMITGILISRTIFDFTRINGGLIVRQIHILAAYWGFILISVHLGMHWGMVIGATRKVTGLADTNHIRTMVLRIMTVLIAAYGVYASFNRDVGSKLILYYTYSYWNFDESVVFFFMDYLSVMGIYICVAYYIMKFIQNRKKF